MAPRETRFPKHKRETNDFPIMRRCAAWCFLSANCATHFAKELIQPA
jgi:hypothetical protein